MNVIFFSNCCWDTPECRATKQNWQWSLLSGFLLAECRKTDQDLVLPTSANGLEEEFGFLPWWFVSRLHRCYLASYQLHYFTVVVLWCFWSQYKQTHLDFKVGLAHTQQICQTLEHPQLLRIRCSICTGIAAPTGLILKSTLQTQWFYVCVLIMLWISAFSEQPGEKFRKFHD